MLWDGYDIAAATGGMLVANGPAGGISTDTRTLQPGDWFLALVGPNFNGHEFIKKAAELGCAGVIVSSSVPSDWSRGHVAVPDTLKALQSLGNHARQAFQGPVVGVTGSSGKTTTRALIGLALSSLGHIHQTAGNLNNHIGVPLTLLAIPPETAACVVELGMNHAGEIAELAAISDPTHRVVLNVGPAHLEGLGSVEGVARAKGELFDTARPGAGHVCFVNADDPLVSKLPIPRSVGVVKFGSREDCHARLLEVEATNSGLGVWARITVQGEPPQEAELALACAGRHLALNACAAAAVAVSLGVPLKAATEAMNGYAPVGMRTKIDVLPWRDRDWPSDANGTIGIEGTGAATVIEGGDEKRTRENGTNQLWLINDAYNANPMSVKAALELLADVTVLGGGRKVAFLADMLELGEAAVDWHMAALRHCKQSKIDLVGTVGELFRQANERLQREMGEEGGEVVRWTVGDSTELVTVACGSLRSGDVVLVKGSRGMCMEKVVDAIRKLADNT